VPHNSSTPETVVLGSSNGAIQVEAVNLDKIRSSLARLDRISEVSLNKEYVAFADQSGKIQKTCPSMLLHPAFSLRLDC
jgi:tubulin-specific chaperone E